MADAEAGQVQPGRRPIAALVSAIPLHLMYAGVQRPVHERMHELPLDIVEGHVDGCSLAEMEAEVGDCVEGVRPNSARVS